MDSFLTLQYKNGKNQNKNNQLNSGFGLGFGETKEITSRKNKQHEIKRKS